MPSNTFYSDINEIWFGYAVNGNKWFDPAAKTQFEQRMKIADPTMAMLQIERANVMAKEVIKWAKAKKYSGRIKKVYWTARPGVMSRALGVEIDQRKNPADILILFTSGPAKGFLGVSAKSTNGSADIGFKNPGMGTVERTLKVDLSSILTKSTNDIVRKLKLPLQANERKEYLRSHPRIQEKTKDAGSMVTAKIRDAMYQKLIKMQQKQLLDYILGNWMDANAGLYPPYIKVTGRGNGGKQFTAAIEDPLVNDKLSAMMTNKLKLEKRGNDGILLKAGSKNIFRMRVKFASEKMASPIKLTADPVK